MPKSPTIPNDGRRRVLIQGPAPVVDGGHHPAKRIQRDEVRGSCDLVSDGHDTVAGRVAFRRAPDTTWQFAPLEPIGNDRWEGSFRVDEVGRWEFRFEAWVDAYSTWRLGTAKKLAAGQEIGLELQMGQRLLEAAAARSGLDISRPKLMDFLDRIHARPAYRRALERGGAYELMN